MKLELIQCISPGYCDDFKGLRLSRTCGYFINSTTAKGSSSYGLIACFPSLISLSDRSHPTEARCPHFLFSVCVGALFSELGTPHSGRGLIYSPTFEVKGNRWGCPRDKQEMGGSQAHCTPQSTVGSSCQAGNGFNRR